MTEWYKTLSTRPGARRQPRVGLLLNQGQGLPGLQGNGKMGMVGPEERAPSHCTLTSTR